MPNANGLQNIVDLPYYSMQILALNKLLRWPLNSALKACSVGARQSIYQQEYTLDINYIDVKWVF